MTQRTHYVLDAKTVAQHRAGRVVAFDAGSIDRAFPSSDGPRANTIEPYVSPKPAAQERTSVAVVSVMGPLAQRSETFCSFVEGYDSISERLIEALNDAAVGGVVLYVDSPGGDVAGLEDAVRRIVEARDASGKPIAVYVDELCASAAYWLASSVSSAGIFAPLAARIGSIGSYCILVDERKSLEQQGIAIKLIRDPAGKAENAPEDPVPDLAVARAQEMVGKVTARFFAAVSAARPVKATALEALNGAVLEAQDAVTFGLIDGVASLDFVVNKVGELAIEAASKDADAARTARATRSRLARIRSRALRRSGEMPKAEDGAAPERAMASDVAASCRECEKSCGECATACESGTADEAISSAHACHAACAANMAVLESFLGMSSEAPPAPEPVEPPPPEDTAAAEQLLRVTGKATRGEALVEVERWRGMALVHEAEQKKLEQEKASLEAQERRSLVAQLVKCGAEIPATAWADDKGTVPAEPWASMSMAALRDRVAKRVAAAPAATTPKPPVRAEESEEIPPRIVEQLKAKGLKGDALERACAEYVDRKKAIETRNGRAPAKGN